MKKSRGLKEKSGIDKLIYIFIFISMFVVLAAYRFYNSQKESTSKKIQAHLNTIAEYKVNELKEWLDQNIYNVIYTFSNDHFKNHLNIFINDTANLESKNQILSLLKYEKENKKLKAALVCDTDGNEIINADSNTDKFDIHELQYVKKAVDTRKPVFTDLYKCEFDNSIHITVYIPIMQKEIVKAIAVIDIDPYISLYPLIKSWPEESKSAESLIVKDEGEDVIFLNDIRFVKDAALQFRISKINRDVPAVMAANGTEGMVEGKDYRGVEVLAVVKKIPKVNWFLVAKVDKAEIYQPLSEKAYLITLLVFTALLGIIASAYLFYKRNKMNYYKSLYELELEKKLIEKNHKELMDHANDIILVMAPNGNIIDANKKAAGTYGYSINEFKKLHYKDLHFNRSVNEFENEFDKTKTIDGNIFETEHKTKDGKAIPVEVSSRFIVIENSSFVQSIIRDISERKYAEEKIRQTNKLLSSIIDGTKDAVFIKDVDGKYILINKATAAFVGKPANEIIGKDDSELFTDGTDEIAFENDRKVFVDGITLNTEENLISDGVNRIYDVIKFPWKDSSDKTIGLIGISRDLTEKYEMINKLKENEERFRSLYENSTIGLYRTTPDGRILLANPTLLKILGYNSLDELTSRNLESEGFNPEYSRDEFKRKININGKITGLESLWKKKDGSYVFIRESAQIVYDSSGNPLYYDGTVEDISERKKFENLLINSEKRYRSLIENAPTAIAISRDMKFVYANPAFLKMYGYDNLNEILSKPITIAVSPKSLDVFTTRAKNREKGLPEDKEYEAVALKKDGTEFFVYVAITRVELNDGPATLRFITDITEHKKSEEALKESEEKYRTVFENVKDVFFITDKNGRLTDISPSIERHTEYPPEELLGKRIDEHFRRKTDQFRLLREIIKTGEVNDFETEMVTRTGKFVYTSINAHLRYDCNKNIIGMEGSIRNITDKKKAEIRLKSSEERYRRFFDEDLTGDYVTTPDGKILMCNRAFVEIIGCESVDEVLKMNAYDLYYENSDREDFLNRLKVNGKLELNELTLRSCDGRKVYVIVNVLADFDDKGEITQISGYMFDITKRKKAELALKESEEKYRYLFDSNPYPMWVYNLDTLKFLAVNDAAVHCYGYSKDEFLNMTIKDIRPSEDIPKLLESINEYDGVDHSGIWRHIKKDGTIINVDITSHALNFDGKKGDLVLALDVTEKLKAQEENLKLSRAVEQSPASIMITNTEGIIEYVNPKFVELTGYTLKEVVRQKPNILKSGKNSMEVYEELWRTIKSGNEWHGEFINRKKNGELYWEAASISPIRNGGGKIMYYIAIKEDITEKKKIVNELIIAKEKAEKSDKLKSEFLAQVSHEIRTPLNAMLSFSNLLQDDLQEKNMSDELIEESISGIRFSGKRIIRTIDAILNMSELKVGTYEHNPVNINLVDDLLSSITRELQPLAKEKNLEFIIENNTTDDSVFCDEYSTGQILVNLIDNAIKYTPSGFVKVELNKDSISSLRLTIEDSGIGMSQEFFDDMYKPFTQEEQGYSRKFEGNGLGLALVKKYCELNSINIDVESEKNKGTKFTLIFPAKNVYKL